MKSLGDVLSSVPVPKPGRVALAGSADADAACPICLGAGYLRLDVPVDDPRFGEMVPCECTLRNQAARRAKMLIERSNLGPLRGKTFETFLVDPRVGRPKNSPEAAFKYAHDFALRPDRSDEERQRKQEHEWLILSGNHGSGKTHLAAAIANHRIGTGQEAIFIVVPDLLDRLRAAYSPTSEVTYDDLFESARETDLLILDDLGAQSTTPWAQEKLYQIINERYNRRLPMVITSNLLLDSMELRLRSRIGDNQLADNVRIQGRDVRLGTDYSPGETEDAQPVRRRSRS